MVMTSSIQRHASGAAIFQLVGTGRKYLHHGEARLSELVPETPLAMACLVFLILAGLLTATRSM